MDKDSDFINTLKQYLLIDDVKILELYTQSYHFNFNILSSYGHQNNAPIIIYTNPHEWGISLPENQEQFVRLSTYDYNTFAIHKEIDDNKIKFVLYVSSLYKYEHKDILSHKDIINNTIIKTKLQSNTPINYNILGMPLILNKSTEFFDSITARFNIDEYEC